MGGTGNTSADVRGARDTLNVRPGAEILGFSEASKIGPSDLHLSCPR